MPDVPTSPTPDLAGGPSPGVRSLVSFLIFLHLFALGVAVSSRATAKGGAVSTFETQLRNVPGLLPYVQLLRMDLSYTYWLTYGPGPADSTDAYHWFEAELTLPDGTIEDMVLPDESIRPGQRTGRYEALARTAGEMLPNESLSSLLPFDMIARLMAESGATRARVRLRQQALPAEPYENGGSPRTVFEASATLTPGGVLFNKLETPTDSAPPPPITIGIP